MVLVAVRARTFTLRSLHNRQPSKHQSFLPVTFVIIIRITLPHNQYSLTHHQAYYGSMGPLLYTAYNHRVQYSSTSLLPYAGLRLDCTLAALHTAVHVVRTRVITER